MPRTTILTRAWATISEPRALSILACVMYICLGIAGIAGLIQPPRAIEGHLSESTILLMAGMLTWAGLIGPYTALRGIRWLEKHALISAIVGLSLHAASTFALHLAEPDNRLTHAATFLALIAMLVSRWLRLGPLPYDRALSRKGREIAHDMHTTGPHPITAP